MDISAISKKNSPKSRMIYHEDPQALHIGTTETTVCRDFLTSAHRKSLCVTRRECYRKLLML